MAGVNAWTGGSDSGSNPTPVEADALAEFRTKFRSLYDENPPFPWQERLFQVFCRGTVPTALDLPTGLGKTSVMSIWLLAHALAEQQTLKRLPRRLVYVVD